jgi:hypothetical protein
LLFSFLLSWLVFNWQIVLALLWYNTETIAGEGYTLLEFVRENTNWQNSFWLPLLFAIVYTLAAPVVKNLINAFNAWNSKWGENWNLRISKGAKVPMEKFLALRENFQKRSAILEDAISKESTTLSELEEARTDLLQARDEQNRLASDVSNLRKVVDNIHRSDILNGPWIRTVYRALGNEQIENIQIHNGRVTVTENGLKVDKYNIQHFMYDSNSNEMHFVLQLIPKDGASETGVYAFDNLRFEHEQLTGNEYSSGGSARVTYSKPTKLLNTDLTEESDKKGE